MIACAAAEVAATGAAAPAPEPKLSSALFVETAVAFVPVANDLPLMLGGGVRFAALHEVWARVGFIPIGDDVRLGFFVTGWRAVFRPGRVVRPTVGGLFAALPEQCGHDAERNPTCEKIPLFIFAATGGVRLEPVPWLGLSAVLTLGMDSYPNPFGMVELGVSFAWPRE